MKGNDVEYPLREIVGFRQDEEGHWVAVLACGHTRHVRHDPPWVTREWVLTDEGRERYMGHRLECRKCDGGTSVTSS